MAPAPDPRRIEVIDDQSAAMLRAKSGQESLAIAFGMFDFAVDVLTASVRDHHPEWTDRQVAEEVSRRLHGAAA